jgi:hypothetical protein
MSHRRTNRYDNLSDEALFKIASRVGNARRRGQVHRALSRRGATQ